jgi:Fic family protein
MQVAYNLSPTIKELLTKIETSRSRLLLMPIPPRTETRLAWEATLSRIYWSLVFSANPLTRNQMAKLLSSSKTKKLKTVEKEVINYKKALGYINQEWLVSGRPVTINTLNTIYDICCKPTVRKTSRITPRSKRELNILFDYLHTSPEHPIIQAGIAQVQLIEIAPFEEGNGRLARLIPYLYLYKSGYKFRGMLVLDEYFRRDLVGLKSAVERVRKNRNLTLWLEYFTRGTYLQLQKAYKLASRSNFITDISHSFWKLNNRQKEILDILDVPGIKITNKMVQDKFKVSQITASRDLSKLHSLELIFVHGKGRSTYYTKA